MMASALRYTVHQYADESDLQRIGVWHLGDVTTASKAKYWIIYIHGGAWRDPRISHKSFEPTITRILASASGLKSSIIAFASIDYRLSPHPDFPQDLGKTPPREYRGAVHPDHVRDVRRGLRFLQLHHGMTSNYILVGHSAGATLAFQILMGHQAVKEAPAPLEMLPLPLCILGLEGIYDFEGLVERKGLGYEPMFKGAFGEKAEWDEASPAKFRGGYKSAWPGGKLALLGWGPDDELVDEPEIDRMAEVLGSDGVRLLVAKDLEGTHDGMWEDGRPLARVILRALGELDREG